MLKAQETDLSTLRGEPASPGKRMCLTCGKRWGQSLRRREVLSPSGGRKGRTWGQAVVAGASSEVVVPGWAS